MLRSNCINTTLVCNFVENSNLIRNTLNLFGVFCMHCNPLTLRNEKPLNQQLMKTNLSADFYRKCLPTWFTLVDCQADHWVGCWCCLKFEFQFFVLFKFDWKCIFTLISVFFLLQFVWSSNKHWYVVDIDFCLFF